MKRILCAATAAAVLALSACTQPVKPIVIDRQQLVQSGNLSLLALEAAVSAYQQKQQIPQRLLTDLQAADVMAHSLLAKLNNDAAVSLPADAQLAANALEAVAVALPPSVLPPAGQAALLAFTALAQVIAQTAPQAVTSPSQVTAPVPGSVAPADAPAPPSVVVPAQPAAQAPAASTPAVDNSVSAPRPPWMPAAASAR